MLFRSLCDRRISARLKGKVYKSVVRPALLHSSETWPIKRAQERRMEVAEMRMLRWMCGVTRRDRIRNDYIRGTVKVTEVTEKMQERRLQWFGHVMRKEEESVCRRVMNMEVPGRRRRGRPRKRWRDTLNEDMRENKQSPSSSSLSPLSSLLHISAPSPVVIFRG